ncbi:MAG: hypothetical protein ACTTKF_07900 [Bacteroides sp.]
MESSSLFVGAPKVKDVRSKEAAKEWGVSTATVRNRIKMGLFYSLPNFNFPAFDARL